MAYYNGNYRAGQRQPVMPCPNQVNARHKNSGCRRNTAPAPSCCGQTADVPPCAETTSAAEKMCLMQPRMTPAESAAQSCVMPSSCCPVAMAYIPFHAFEELFEESKAFMVGTAFPSLFKPFMRGGSCR